MLIVDKNKSIDLNIVGYEFPNANPSKKSECFDYDANWLTITLNYKEKNVNETYTDNCLLTCELFDLIKALQCIINDKDDNYMSDFLEPYLSVCITKIDTHIVFVLSFVYNTDNNKWLKRTVSAKWTKQTANDKLTELKDMGVNFPQR